MPFRPEQDAFVLMAHCRSRTHNEDGSWSYSLQSCIDQFTAAFLEVEITYTAFDQHKRAVIHRFEEKHCICKGKSTGRPTVLTDEKVADIRNRMELSSHKSISKMAAQTGISVGSCHKAFKKNLHTHPYKVTAVQQLLQHDWRSRMEYCRWFNNNLNNNILDLTFMSDDAWFNLSGSVNIQNYRTWATKNPQELVENSLHPLKICVWVAMSRKRIIGPIFFNETINAQRLHSSEELQAAIQQEIENITIDDLQKVFDSMKRGVNLCLENNGQHTEHLM